MFLTKNESFISSCKTSSFFDLDILKFELQQTDIDLLSDPAYFKEMSEDITEDEANEKAEGFRKIFDELGL